MPPHWNHIPVVEIKALKECFTLAGFGYVLWRVKRLLRPSKRTAKKPLPPSPRLPPKKRGG